ncbi:MAG: SCP2 sterol-binding domain-containing protein [Anaerolineales bacterium]|jgi:putative sterol carrier protein
MAIYPSQEWCDTWKKAINDDPAIAKTGQKWGLGFNGDWLFVITPGAGLEKTTYVYLEAAAGKCEDARILSDPAEEDPGFVVTGSYEDFKSVVKGEKDFLALVVKGTFKLKGDMGKIMRFARFIRAVANSISSFESEFLGE